MIIHVQILQNHGHYHPCLSQSHQNKRSHYLHIKGAINVITIVHFSNESTTVFILILSKAFFTHCQTWDIVGSCCGNLIHSFHSPCIQLLKSMFLHTSKGCSWHGNPPGITASFVVFVVCCLLYSWLDKVSPELVPHKEQWLLRSPSGCRDHTFSSYSFISFLWPEASMVTVLES